MAWQNWDQQDVHTTEDNAFSYLPTPDPQPTDFSSQWLFTPSFMAPAWPTTFHETHMSTGFEALLNPPSDVPLDPLDLSSEDAIIWEVWDTRDEIGSKGIAGSDASVMKMFVAGQAPSQTQNSSPLMERSLFSTLQKRGATGKANTRNFRTASRPSRSEFSDLYLPQSHTKTEKKYRLNLNDQYSALLNALPNELVLSTVSGGIGIHGEKVATKSETLNLAVAHIRVLESDQAELKRDSLSLKGQVDLFERLIKGPGG